MRTISMTAAACVLALLAGCRTGESTRVSVINETGSTLLIEGTLETAETPAFTAEEVDPGMTRAFEISHRGVDRPAVQLGVRPIELAQAPTRWVEFAPPGPHLLRVQGPATDLRFIATRDTTDLDASEIEPIREHRLGAEPPVNPRP